MGSLRRQEPSIQPWKLWHKATATGFVVVPRLPQTQWQDALKGMSSVWGMEGDVSEIHVDSLEHTSKPFHLAYHYHKDNYFKVPNAGVSFRILPPMQLRFARSANPKKPLEPVNVGPAIEETTSIVSPHNFGAGAGSGQHDARLWRVLGFLRSQQEYAGSGATRRAKSERTSGLAAQRL